ncbi:junctional adhesion molecule B-like [Arapaima gigas]
MLKHETLQVQVFARASRDPNSDPYTSLDVQNRSPDYDTLTVVNRAARHTNTELQTSAQTSDTYASLDVNSRSPEYDTLTFSHVVKSSAGHRKKTTQQ